MTNYILVDTSIEQFVTEYIRANHTLFIDNCKKNRGRQCDTDMIERKLFVDDVFNDSLTVDGVATTSLDISQDIEGNEFSVEGVAAVPDVDDTDGIVKTVGNRTDTEETMPDINEDTFVDGVSGVSLDNTSEGVQPYIGYDVTDDNDDDFDLDADEDGDDDNFDFDDDGDDTDDIMVVNGELPSDKQGVSLSNTSGDIVISNSNEVVNGLDSVTEAEKEGYTDDDDFDLDDDTEDVFDTSDLTDDTIMVDDTDIAVDVVGTIDDDFDLDDDDFADMYDSDVEEVDDGYLSYSSANDNDLYSVSKPKVQGVVTNLETEKGVTSSREVEKSTTFEDTVDNTLVTNVDNSKLSLSFNNQAAHEVISSVNDNEVTVHKGIVYERGMSLIDFLRANKTLRDISTVLEYYSQAELERARKSGRILVNKRKGKVIL